jgi:hypothetical protein
MPILFILHTIIWTILAIGVLAWLVIIAALCAVLLAVLTLGLFRLAKTPAMLIAILAFMAIAAIPGVTSHRF